MTENIDDGIPSLPDDLKKEIADLDIKVSEGVWWQIDDLCKMYMEMEVVSDVINNKEEAATQSKAVADAVKAVAIVDGFAVDLRISQALTLLTEFEESFVPSETSRRTFMYELYKLFEAELGVTEWTQEAMLALVGIMHHARQIVIDWYGKESSRTLPWNKMIHVYYANDYIEERDALKEIERELPLLEDRNKQEVLRGPDAQRLTKLRKEKEERDKTFKLIITDIRRCFWSEKQRLDAFHKLILDGRKA